MYLRIAIFLLTILFLGTIQLQAKKDKDIASVIKPVDSSGNADSLVAKGNYYFWQFRHKEALNNYFKALTIYDNLHNKKDIGLTYTRIAYVYIDMNCYTQAEKYVNKALLLGSALNDTLCLAHSYNLMKNIKFAERKWDECLEYAEKCIQLSYILKQYTLITCSTNQKALVYMKLKQYSKALKIANEALALSEKMENEYHISESKMVIAEIYSSSGQLALAEKSALNVLQSADTNDYQLMFDIYKLLVQIYAQKGDDIKLSENLELLSLSLYKQTSKTMSASLAEMEVKYETENKELKITALENEKKLIIGLSIAGIAFLMTLLAIAFLLWRSASQKKRISEQQIIQLQQEKQLIANQAVLDGEVQERARIANDLHDRLGSMLSGVKLNLELLNKIIAFTPDEMKYFENAMKILNGSMIEMRRVAHHLMPDSLSRYGLKAALKDFCDNFECIELVWFGKEERLTDRKKEVLIYNIIHELVNNALKHSGASKIGVNIMHEEDYFAFTVYDNGCGFDKDKQTKGTGLKNIHERVTAYNGRFEITTKVDEGTEVNVELKIEI